MAAHRENKVLQNIIQKVLPRGFLIVNGLIYGVLAALFVVTPRVWFANLGIELIDEMGYTELQTMYVGMMGSLAVFSLMAVGSAACWSRRWSYSC